MAANAGAVKERVDRRHEIDTKYDCTKYTVNRIKSRKDDLRDLPGPSETWIMRETDLPSELNIGALRREGIIKKVGERLVGHDYLNEYQTIEEAYDALETILEEANENSSGLLPCCTQSSIKNEVGVDGITCGNCGTVHDRDDLTRD